MEITGGGTDAALATGEDANARLAVDEGTGARLAVDEGTGARLATDEDADAALATGGGTNTALATGPDADAALATDEGTNAALAAGVAAALERLLGLFRWLSPPTGLSLTAAATLATLERTGPCRLTVLADREAVTQPAMTQLVARLQEAGVVTRSADPSDGRVVQVRITDAGRAVLADRRAVRAERLAGMLADLSAADRAALAAALPAMDSLAAAQRAGPLGSTR